jgi:hypothetical protein
MVISSITSRIAQLSTWSISYYCDSHFVVI